MPHTNLRAYKVTALLITLSLLVASAATNQASASQPEKLPAPDNPVHGDQGVYSAPLVSRDVVLEAKDYATTAFANPWDFGNSKDLALHESLTLLRITDAEIKNGQFTGTSTDRGYFRMQHSWDIGAIPWGTDGALHPITAKNYTHLSFRMWTDVDTKKPYYKGQILWDDCGQLRAICRGGTKFMTKPGWHTYTIKLENDSAVWNKNWSGKIRGIAVMPTGAGEHDFKIDWMRLTKPTPAGTVTVTPPRFGTEELYWDRDTNPDNNTASSAKWSYLGRTSSQEPYVWQTAHMPPGKYFLYTIDDDGTRSQYRQVQINSRPRPQILNPDLAGGDDWATTQLKDPWDFSNAGDAFGFTNMAGTVSNGKLIARNAGPTTSDSYLFFNLGGKVIDTRIWDRLTVRVFYEGGFDLTPDPGGGMNARIAWTDAVTYKTTVSDDIVVLPGWNTITIDLGRVAKGEILENTFNLPEPDISPWSGSKINGLRFDPHEDEGIREFKIDWVKLRRSDRSRRGKVNIKFRDRAFEPGTVVQIFADTNNKGFNGTQIGTVETKRGQNTFVWEPTAADKGDRWIHMTFLDPAGNKVKVYSDAEVRVR